MALIRCKKCQHVMAHGIMPTSTCGLLLIPAFALSVASFGISRHFIGWWAILIPVPMLFLSTLAIHYVPYTIEWLTAFLHRCPQCGSRRWSYPFTSGFGL